MEELETENLQQLLKGTKLSAYQMALANREYQHLIIFAYDMEQKVKNNVGLGAVIPSIYSLKLHEVIALTPTSIEGDAVSYYSVMRVAGGWIYQVWDTEKQDYVRETFVPFNNDMMSV